MKKYVRFIFPLLVVVLIVVLVISSKLGKKESGKDVYISFENESTSEEDKYIDGVYESVVKPNYSIEEDSDSTSIDISTDKITIDNSNSEILIKDEEGNIVVQKVSDLLGDNKPTNNSMLTVSSAELNNPSGNTVDFITSSAESGGLPYKFSIPNSMAYDTEIVEREIDGVKGYVGCLYGLYIYSIPSKYVEMFNITKLHIIASQGRYVQLGFDESIGSPISLRDGKIVYTTEP